MKLDDLKQDAHDVNPTANRHKAEPFDDWDGLGRAQDRAPIMFETYRREIERADKGEVIAHGLDAMGDVFGLLARDTFMFPEPGESKTTDQQFAPAGADGPARRHHPKGWADKAFDRIRTKAGSMVIQRSRIPAPGAVSREDRIAQASKLIRGKFSGLEWARRPMTVGRLETRRLNAQAQAQYRAAFEAAFKAGFVLPYVRSGRICSITRHVGACIPHKPGLEGPDREYGRYGAPTKLERLGMVKQVKREIRDGGDIPENIYKHEWDGGNNLDHNPVK